MPDAVQDLPFAVELALPVRTYDIDFAGIVSNIVYVRWLEDLRLEMMACHFPLTERLDSGIAPIVLKTTVDYKQPIQLSDQPIGRMGMKAMDSLRWTVAATITVRETVSAVGEQMGVFINLQSRRPTRLPASLRRLYREATTSA